MPLDGWDAMCSRNFKAGPRNRDNGLQKTFPAHFALPRRIDIHGFFLVFKHLAYAAGGIGNAAGDAGDEALLLRRLCLGGRFRLCGLSRIGFLILFLGDGIAVFHLIIAVAILWTLALLFVSCHNYHATRLCQN